MAPYYSSINFKLLGTTYKAISVLALPVFLSSSVFTDLFPSFCALEYQTTLYPPRMPSVFFLSSVILFMLLPLPHCSFSKSPPQSPPWLSLNAFTFLYYLSHPSCITVIFMHLLDFKLSRTTSFHFQILSLQTSLGPQIEFLSIHNCDRI